MLSRSIPSTMDEPDWPNREFRGGVRAKDRGCKDDFNWQNDDQSQAVTASQESAREPGSSQHRSTSSLRHSKHCKSDQLWRTRRVKIDGIGYSNEQAVTVYVSRQNDRGPVSTIRRSTLLEEECGMMALP